MMTLRDTRAVLDAVDTALEVLGNAPPEALETLDRQYQFHRTMLGRVTDALEKERGRISAQLRKLELAAYEAAS